MKGFGMLLLYFFTWRSVIVGSVFVGLALLALAFSLAGFSSSAAAAVSLLAFVLMLAVPYISAPKALRTIISNRRLALVPGLPPCTGLAMLLLTIVTAGFIPLTGWLLGAPEVIFWLGPQIFIIASIYTLVTQMLVTSRHVWIHVQWLPIAVIVLLTLFGAELLQIATNRTALMLLTALALGGWLYVLAILARRRNFKPGTSSDMMSADRDSIMFLSSLFRRKPEQDSSPVSSLLLGYPASMYSRAVNIVFLIVLNPLLSVALLEFMARHNNGDRFLSGTTLFLAMSVFTSFVAGAVVGAETGPRARLLWLRIPGSRAQVWEKIESELRTWFTLLAAVMAVVALVIWSYGAASMLLLHYVLTLFTLSLYQRYLPLAARVNGWSLLTQAVVSLASFAAIAFTIGYIVTVASLNAAFVLELCLLLLGLLFRALAKFGFHRIDWQVVRPAPSKGQAVA